LLDDILAHIKKCNTCQDLPLGPRPVVTAHPKSKIIIIGQAPGTAVHQSGIPWDDKSGENLRSWMDIEKDVFYDTEKIAIIPMGFCYPGRGKTGDLPPRKECAPQWHNMLISQLKEVELVLLVGKYAQDSYLGKEKRRTLTDTVRNYKDYLPRYFVLPHPSPRNNIWQAKNEWFKRDVLPELKAVVSEVL
jgi:uracil-DNA glycosylase|tara:strand:- start:541 stop:1110 length:570 start_codon:yes stop_codon:yes gene_type:complete